MIYLTILTAIIVFGGIAYISYDSLISLSDDSDLAG